MLHSSQNWMAAFALALILGSNSAAPAGQISIFSTGVDASGNPLPGGSLDPHYTIDAGAVAAGGSGPWVISSPGAVLWVANTASSSWISSKVDTHEAPNTTYSTTFDLTGLDPNTAVLNGLIAPDDTATVYLNGILEFTDSAGKPWTALIPFTISSDFRSGMNTLDFVVPNDIANNPGLDGPGGLQVQISGTAATNSTAAAVPVPSTLTMALVICGIFSIAWAYRQNRRLKLAD